MGRPLVSSISIQRKAAPLPGGPAQTGGGGAQGKQWSRGQQPLHGLLPPQGDDWDRDGKGWPHRTVSWGL